MQNVVMRAKTFNIRFSDDEWARIERLSTHHGLTAAALFRLLLKKEERALGIPAPAGTRLKTVVRTTRGPYTALYFNGDETAAKDSEWIARSYSLRPETPAERTKRVEGDAASEEERRVLQSVGSLQIEGTPGSWYLATLLEDGGYTSDTQTLDIDHGQGWTILNPKELLDEIKAIVGSERFSGLIATAKKLKRRSDALWAEIFASTGTRRSAKSSSVKRRSPKGTAGQRSSSRNGG